MGKRLTLLHQSLKVLKLHQISHLFVSVFLAKIIIFGVVLNTQKGLLGLSLPISYFSQCQVILQCEFLKAFICHLLIKVEGFVTQAVVPA